jgi:hypothetical protein
VGWGGAHEAQECGAEGGAGCRRAETVRRRGVKTCEREVKR